METLWRCEDEEEAYGVELLLTRAGIRVHARDDGHVTTFEGDAAARKRVEQLESKIAHQFALRHDRELATRLAAGEKRIRRIVYGCAVAVAIVLAWLA